MEHSSHLHQMAQKRSREVSTTEFLPSAPSSSRTHRASFRKSLCPSKRSCHDPRRVRCRPRLTVQTTCNCKHESPTPADWTACRRILQFSPLRVTPGHTSRCDPAASMCENCTLGCNALGVTPLTASLPISSDSIRRTELFMCGFEMIEFDAVDDVLAQVIR